MPRGSPRREEEAEVFDVENGRQEDERLVKLGILALCLLVCISPLDVFLSCLAFIAIPSLSIAFITIGFVYLQDCELEPMIPMWLVIQGLLILFGFVVERSSRCFQAKKPPSASSSSSSSFCTSFASSSPPVRVLSIILTLVSIAWLTAGNLWVFGAFRQKVIASDGEESCDPVVYIISYITVLASDVAFALFPLLLLVPLLCSRLC